MAKLSFLYMKVLYCWRCKRAVPMLDEDEYAKAYLLYGEAFKMGASNTVGVESLAGRFKPLLDFYNELTGFGETEPNAVMHHRVALYGPPCEQCGKPYRTPQASFCASCGHKRVLTETV